MEVPITGRGISVQGGQREEGGRALTLIESPGHARPSGLEKGKDVREVEGKACGCWTDSMVGHMDAGLWGGTECHAKGPPWWDLQFIVTGGGSVLGSRVDPEQRWLRWAEPGCLLAADGLRSELILRGGQSVPPIFSNFHEEKTKVSFQVELNSKYDKPELAPTLVARINFSW